MVGQLDQPLCQIISREVMKGLTNLLPLFGPVEAYGGPALTSLELVNYPETMLSENALRGLTSLKSLTVRYRYLKIGVKCRLQSWLSYLPQLESLEIIGKCHHCSMCFCFF